MKPSQSKKNQQQPQARSPWLPVLVGAAVLLAAWFAVRPFLSNLNPAEAVPEVPTVAPASVGVPVAPVTNTIIDAGLAVTFTAKPVSGQPELSELSFAFTDPATGQPVEPETPPSVWIGSQESRINNTQGSQLLECKDKVKLYVQGTLDYRPEIDLNSYFILTLNSDPTISVIDPLGGVTGISQLYAMIELKSPGEDWAITPDGKLLFVTLPENGEVAVVDTENFAIKQYISSGGRPTRIALQPDGKRLWVTNDTDNLDTSGVTIIDIETLSVLSRIPTGTGRHALAFSGEVANTHAHDPQKSSNTAETTSYAFVASEQGTLSVIDLATLDFVASVDIKGQLTGLAYSAPTNVVYVSAATGVVTRVDAASHEILGQVSGVAQGAATLRFDPAGRWGFVLSPAENLVSVIDAQTNTASMLAVEGMPDKVSFTPGYAYIHLAEKPEVMLVDLNQLTLAAPLQAVKVIGGQTAPNQAPAELSVADAIVSVHEHGGHVLIANPGDQSVYYYMEGMNAPMGSFQTYSRTPRAVTVVDRSIRRIAPGSYQALVKLPHAGNYEAAFLLDTPRILHCFPFNTTDDANVGVPAATTARELTIEFLTAERRVKAGQPFNLQFKIKNNQTGAPISNLTDVYVLATIVSGQRNDRFKTRAMADGLYEASLQFAEPGLYKVYFFVPSLNVNIEDLPFLTLQVDAP